MHRLKGRRDNNGVLQHILRPIVDHALREMTRLWLTPEGRVWLTGISKSGIFDWSPRRSLPHWAEEAQFIHVKTD